MKKAGRRDIWQLVAFIEATPEQADEALEAIGRALCPDEQHPGYCPVPWATMSVRFDDLKKKERRAWRKTFAKERKVARRTGEPGI